MPPTQARADGRAEGRKMQTRQTAGMTRREMPKPARGWSVLAHGQDGARELNYSSDIDNRYS